MTENEPRRRRRRTLTDKMVAALPKKRRRYVTADPEMRGLYIRVPSEGPSVFVAVARNPYGKQVWATLDGADVLKIEEARDRARKAIKRIKAGLPAVEEPPVKPDSFQSVAENWLKRHVVANKLRTQNEIERCLAKYVLPHWKSRPFTGIRRSDVAGLLDVIEDGSGPRQADVVLTILRSIANWYATRHDEYLSPFMRGMRRDKAGGRDRVLNDAELLAVWAQAKKAGTFGALVRILLLTGQRRSAVAGMRWSDLADGVWTIATAEREKSNAGALALPPQAIAIIEAQPHMAGNPFVFASARGDGPLDSFSGVKASLDAAAGVSGWTLHDLRRTARSLMSRAGVSSEHAERVLGHVQPGVRGIYDRHKYDAEKADALVKLAALVDTITNPLRLVATS
jgi:integrase